MAATFSQLAYHYHTADKMHPAVVIFLSVVFTQAIAALGKARLQEILYSLYASVVNRSVLSRQRRMRKEIYATKQELAATSSQDEFAKWAKLKRKVDKGLADLEKTNAELSSSRSTFGMLFKGVMFLLTTIMPFFVTSWYGKTPIFWLPPAQSSWFGPLGWFLAFPRAPKGAISSTVWQMVCTRSIIAITASLTNLLPGKSEEVLAEGPLPPQNEKKPAPASAQQPAPAAGARKRATAAPAEKDEL